MQSLAIIVFCVLAAVSYGIIHDQVTARVCVEYFTIGHPPLFTFPTESPTLLGFGWGIAATWWVGLILGVALAVAARAGGRPKIDVQQLYRSIAVLLATAACAALASGIIGYILGRGGIVYLLEPLASSVPVDRHGVFLADLWAHSASYGVAFIGGLTVIGHTRWRRARLMRDSDKCSVND